MTELDLFTESAEFSLCTNKRCIRTSSTVGRESETYKLNENICDVVNSRQYGKGVFLVKINTRLVGGDVRANTTVILRMEVPADVQMARPIAGFAQYAHEKGSLRIMATRRLLRP